MNAVWLKGTLSVNVPRQGLVFVAKGVVEDDVARREERFLDEFARFLGSVPTIHALIFPFDGERAVVVNVVQRANDRFEVDVPVP